MPLLSPQTINPGLKAALKEAGLDQKNSKKLESNLDELLESSGLDATKVLEEVGNLMKYAEQENTRLAAAKIGLQLNRMLEDDDIKRIPIVNINILDSEYTQINPILIPR
jgi:hypothetical protein